MRLQTVQIIAALAAAIAFVLAFITAGVAIISGVCMLAGLLALGWAALSLIRHVRRRERRRTA